MDLIKNRIAQNLEFAWKIIGLGSQIPTVYTNTAIIHHPEIAEAFMTLNEKPEMLCGHHERLAHQIIELTTDAQELAYCAKHLSVAEKLIHHKSAIVQAACAQHPSLTKHFSENSPSIVLASLVLHDYALAERHKNHKHYLVRKACATHEKIAEFYINQQEYSPHVITEITKHKNLALSHFDKVTNHLYLQGWTRFEELAQKLTDYNDVKVRANCAKHLSIATQLINDPFWIVRKECAEHKELKHHFIKDKEAFVRSICAADAVFGAKMANDPEEIVLMQIAGNPHTAHLMINHPSFRVSEKARFILSIW